MTARLTINAKGRTFTGLALLFALAACSAGGEAIGPQEASEDEAEALQEAAYMLDQRAPESEEAPAAAKQAE